MKVIKFSSVDRCAEVAQEMNPDYKVVVDNCTRGNSYYEWAFSDDATILVSTSGHGKLDGRFTIYHLVKGTAYKVGRNSEDLDFYNESVKV